jgi:CHAT domain-containing protein/tetratricopeptide (TPR) repeat protein
MEHRLEALKPAIRQLAAAESPDAVRQILGNHPALLEPECDAILTWGVQQSWRQRRKTDTRNLLACRSFLAQCRRQALETVLARTPALPLGPNSPFGRLLKLSYRRSDLPRRAALARQALEHVRRATEPDLWATLHRERADCLAQSEGPDRAERLEEALDAYRKTLDVWGSAPYAGSPKWAQTLHALAATLRRRVRGRRTENLQQALALYEQALTVRTEKERPLEWAHTQHDLGALWMEMPTGDRTANAQKGIEHYRAALTVRTRDAHPLLWARTSHDLAIAYTEQPAKDREQNLEEAIRLCQEVQKILTPAQHPLDWGRSQVALANAYLLRLRGDRTENLERAIKHYRCGLTTLTRNAFPADHARAHYDLAIAYQHRPAGDPAENLEQAIDHYQQALEIYAPNTYPLEWAHVQTGLGNAYCQPWAENRAQSLEQAITCYEKALEVRTQESDPHGWATIQNNLGNAYADRVEGERVANQEKAIACYENALHIRTRRTTPARWAETLNNLGAIFIERLRGHRAENQARAIDYLQQALEVHEPHVFPNDSRRAARNLAHLFFTRKQWKEAARHYRTALKATELLYQAGATPVARQAELGEARNLAAQAAYCLARLGQIDEAVEILEQGKARAIGEALALNEAALEDAAEPDRRAFVSARTRIAALEAQMRAAETPEAAEYVDISTALAQARGDLADAVASIQRYMPGFMPAQSSLRQIASVAAALNRPLAYLLTTPLGSLAVIIPPDACQLTEQHTLWLDRFTEKTLTTLLKGAGGHQGDGYLAAQVSGGSGKLEAVLDRALALLGERLMAPLARRLQELGFSAFALIPGGLLSLLPLHAARYSDGYLLDEFEISFSPSARTLAHCHNRLARARTAQPTLFAVGNPLPPPRGFLPLNFARAEVEAIAAFFPQNRRTTLLEGEATHAAVSEALEAKEGKSDHYLHFACHGVFDSKKPLDSGILLAHGEPLTLKQLLDEIALPGAELAVLSACQTAIVDFENLPDEAIGLPGGFLTAGVPGVIGSLWSVSDLSTPILMERLYYFHLKGKMSPAAALGQAQKWLRRATAQELGLAERFERFAEASSGAMRDSALEAVERHRQHPDRKPFAHPFHWAAFVFSGVGG